MLNKILKGGRGNQFKRFIGIELVNKYKMRVLGV